MKHQWYRHEDGNVDTFRLDIDFHNGPQCMVCGEAFCHHCSRPSCYDVECAGADEEDP
jgi:hypothetical protein